MNTPEAMTQIQTILEAVLRDVLPTERDVAQDTWHDHLITIFDAIFKDKKVDETSPRVHLQRAYELMNDSSMQECLRNMIAVLDR